MLSSSAGFARAKEYLFTGDLMTAAEAERIGLINHVVPADQLDEKVYGLARRLASGAMRSIRWTKQAINIPLRQLAHSMMDLSLNLETQSNLTKPGGREIDGIRDSPLPRSRA
jgi:enoyl-CoA hydratase/carnithine racemase